ncbi:MAG: flagellar hook-length control protein FliK [Armatimonadota bacterium]
MTDSAEAGNGTRYARGNAKEPRSPARIAGAADASEDVRSDPARDGISRRLWFRHDAGSQPAFDEVGGWKPTTGVEAVRVLDPPRGLLESLRDGAQERLHIELSPPELGRCELELTVRDGAVLAVIVAERPETVAAMRSAESQVREALAGHDLQMAEFDVREGGAGDARHAPPDRTEGRQAPLPRLLLEGLPARNVWRPPVGGAARRVDLVA